MRRIFLLVMLGILSWAPLQSVPAEVVVLTEAPVAEFTLPDGTVLRNAFVWRRSSEGLMIVHDGGQYFLNYKTLPDAWKAAYLGTPEAGGAALPEVPPATPVELNDRFGLRATLERVPGLDEAGMAYLLGADAPEAAVHTLLDLALAHDLLADNQAEAKRLMLIGEELGKDFDPLDVEALFTPCKACAGEGTIAADCRTCAGSGKCPRCGGDGQRDTGMGSATTYCTTCKGTGKCADCGGEGSIKSRCRACGGRGKLLDRPMCEALRIGLVRTAQAAAGAAVPPLPSDPEAGVGSALAGLPGLSPAALDFYRSADYAGDKDLEILAACLMHALLKGNGEGAKRFDSLIKAIDPEQELIVLEDYLKPCAACDGTGWATRDCRDCKGSGKCARCGGSGTRPSEFKNQELHCTTCKGSGKCLECEGKGRFTIQCGACEGKGFRFEKQRTEIKLGILVDGLNARARSPEPPAE